MAIVDLLEDINRYILNPIIVLAFAIAFAVFFWGIFQFISKETTGGDRDKGKKKILYGVIGMFIMFAAYGLVQFVLNTFGIDDDVYPLNEAPSETPL